MTQTAILLGADPKTATQELDDVIKFETRLANVSRMKFPFASHPSI